MIEFIVYLFYLIALALNVSFLLEIYVLGKKERETDRIVLSNPHPKGYNIGDCSVRMLCNIFDVSWDEAYDMLLDMSRKTHFRLYNTDNIQMVLIDRGFNYYGKIKDSVLDSLTLDEFVRRHDKGRYALFSETHTVAVIDGKILDAYDSHAKTCCTVIFGNDLSEDMESDEMITEIFEIVE